MTDNLPVPMINYGESDYFVYVDFEEYINDVCRARGKVGYALHYKEINKYFLISSKYPNDFIEQLTRFYKKFPKHRKFITPFENKIDIKVGKGTKYTHLEDLYYKISGYKIKKSFLSYIFQLPEDDKEKMYYFNVDSAKGINYYEAFLSNLREFFNLVHESNSDNFEDFVEQQMYRCMLDVSSKDYVAELNKNTQEKINNLK